MKPLHTAFCFLLAFFCLSATAQKTAPKARPATAKPAAGYNISLKLTPYKNEKVYIGCYYGKYKKLVDSTGLDGSSMGRFTGAKKLPAGLYFLVSPHRTILFDVLMDSVQQMSIAADSARPEEVVITGSRENALYQDYTRYLAVHGPVLSRLSGEMKTAKSAADSTRITDAYKKENDALMDYRRKVIQQHPGSMLALFFNALKKPEPPTPLPLASNGRPDSSFAFYFTREHFWDDISFSDDRLLYTPFFDPRVDEYFKYYVSPDPDSISQEINVMLLSARESREMFNYLLARFTDEYINPKIMGQDKVFVFLFNNFFSKGDTTFLNEKQRKFIFERAYSLMANQIGEAGSPLDMAGIDGSPVKLYETPAKYTFLIFWDHTCGHCKEQIPRVDSIYRAKWQAEGVRIFSVNTNERMHGDAPGLQTAVRDWKALLAEKNISASWVHAYQPQAQRQAEEKNRQPNYRQLYDVYQTPTFYLLDDQKRIIGKKLTLEQFDGLIDAKRK